MTDLADELRELKGLLDADLITPAEYGEKAAAIASRVETRAQAEALRETGLMSEEEAERARGIAEAAEEAERRRVFAEAEKLEAEGTVASMEKAVAAYRELGDYQGAGARAEGLQRKLDALKAQKGAKAKKQGIIAGIVIVVVIAVALVVTQVVMPAQRRAALETAGLSASMKVGDTVKLGSYEQDNNTSNGKETIEWRVLAVENGKALLISRYGLDCRQFNSSNSKGNDWNSSDLKSWLEGEFASTAFSDAEKAVMSGSVFCLSVEEANKYFSSDRDRMCAPTAYAVAQGAYQRSSNKVDGVSACYWWLRSAGSFSGYAADVGTGGYVGSNGDHVTSDNNAVRPALWINL